MWLACNDESDTHSRGALRIAKEQGLPLNLRFRSRIGHEMDDGFLISAAVHELDSSTFVGKLGVTSCQCNAKRVTTSDHFAIKRFGVKVLISNLPSVKILGVRAKIDERHSFSSRIMTFGIDQRGDDANLARTRTAGFRLEKLSVKGAHVEVVMTWPQYEVVPCPFDPRLFAWSESSDHSNSQEALYAASNKEPSNGLQIRHLASSVSSN